MQQPNQPRTVLSLLIEQNTAARNNTAMYDAFRQIAIEGENRLPQPPIEPTDKFVLHSSPSPSYIIPRMTVRDTSREATPLNTPLNTPLINPSPPPKKKSEITPLKTQSILKKPETVDPKQKKTKPRCCTIL